MFRMLCNLQCSSLINLSVMSLLELKEKISEQLEAIDLLSEGKPMPKIIQPHLTKIKKYFEQHVEMSEECRRLCDELREAKERPKGPLRS
uniref:BLOC-1-related complex subunit 5 n=1 Tax=Steinernema glaseri TaxID=37863 RepID=A0A1I7Y024_9BILA